MSANSLTFPIRSDKLTLTASVNTWLLSRKTEFQRIDIVETEVFGRALLLDNHIQLTEFDEHAYHEALVHIPLLSIQNPRSALVIGGGDGGVLRELAKHKAIEHIDMVEIDAGVIEASREYLPSVHGGAFDDPRMHVRIEDAFSFVKNADRAYDLIVADSTDTYEDEDGALSEMLFTEGFYRDCQRILNPKGFLVTQADNLMFCPYSLESIQQLFTKVFQKVGNYQALVPSFGGMSGYCWASNGAEIGTEFPKTAVEELGLRYLNEATWALAFSKLGF